MTPGFLRGQVVNQIIATMHTAGERGPWAVESVETGSRGALSGHVESRIVMVVGTIYELPDGKIKDDRRRVTITVRDDSGM